MEKVKVKCGACDEINFVSKKPEPQNASEAKRIYFHCRFCGVKNLRDGTFSGQSFSEEPEELEEESEKAVGDRCSGLDKTVVSSGKKEKSEDSIVSWIIGIIVTVLGALFIEEKMKKKEEGRNSQTDFNYVDPIR